MIGRPSYHLGVTAVIVFILAVAGVVAPVSLTPLGLARLVRVDPGSVRNAHFRSELLCGDHPPAGDAESQTVRDVGVPPGGPMPRDWERFVRIRKVAGGRGQQRPIWCARGLLRGHGDFGCYQKIVTVS